MAKACSDNFSDEDVRRQYEAVTPDDIEEINRKIENEGVGSAKSYIESKLDGWKYQPLNCGIIGSSGSGKSSFINAIRGVTPQDENAASVDVVECTTEPTPYPDPKNLMLQYWDLPGVGTSKLPKGQSYFQQISFERYDFFFIITATRFSENDMWLATQIQKAGKKFFFVRSKIDQDLWSEKKYRVNFNADSVMEKIRNECVKKLQTQFESPEVFLISNFEPQMYEFPSLCLKLIKSLPQLKKEAMTLSLRSLSNTMIAEKKRILQNRVWYVSLLSAVANACAAPFPLPRLRVIDYQFIKAELKFYQEQFGISEEMLASSQKVHPDTFDMVAMIRSAGTSEDVATLLSKIACSITPQEYIRYLPGIGILTSGGFSFATTYQMLNGYLDKLEKILLKQ